MIGIIIYFVFHITYDKFEEEMNGKLRYKKIVRVNLNRTKSPLSNKVGITR